MSGEQRWAGSDSADLTARARIRNAAIELFGARGAAAVSMRDVAAAAEVSLGLVQHHFGTKDKLRVACDEYAVRFVRDTAQQGLVDGAAADGDFIAAVHRAGPPVLRYLAKAIVDGSPGAVTLFDELRALTEASLRADSALAQACADVDFHAVAAVLTAMKLGMGAMLGPLIGVLGQDDPETWERLNSAVLTVISPDVTSPRVTELARKGLADNRAKNQKKK